MIDDPHENAADEAFNAAVDLGPDGGAAKSNAKPVDVNEQLRIEAAECRDRALRAQAELDNVRKRLYREMDDARKYADMPLLTDLLPVMDNVGRAIEAALKSPEASAIVDGFKLVQQQLETVFNRHHCQKIAALHKPFDPHLHMAIMQQPTNDHPPGTIVLVAQDGYQLHDRVVRPSQVIVAKAME